MYYMNSKSVIAQIGAQPTEEQEDRLDRLHTGETFLGISVRLQLDGSYALVAHEGAPEPGTIPLTEPGQSTLSDDGLCQAHEILAPRAKAYGDAEDGQQRARVLGLSYIDVQCLANKLDTITDLTSSMMEPEWGGLVANIPSGLSEREVIEWVYENALGVDHYANRDQAASYMLECYPDIEESRDALRY